MQSTYGRCRLLILILISTGWCNLVIERQKPVCVSSAAVLQASQSHLRPHAAREQSVHEAPLAYPPVQKSAISMCDCWSWNWSSQYYQHYHVQVFDGRTDFFILAQMAGMAFVGYHVMQSENL